MISLRMFFVFEVEVFEVLGGFKAWFQQSFCLYHRLHTLDCLCHRLHVLDCLCHRLHALMCDFIFA